MAQRGVDVSEFRASSGRLACDRSGAIDKYGAEAVFVANEMAVCNVDVVDQHYVREKASCGTDLDDLACNGGRRGNDKTPPYYDRHFLYAGHKRPPWLLTANGRQTAIANAVSV